LKVNEFEVKNQGRIGKLIYLLANSRNLKTH
jgi:hypothetical protein